MITSISDIIVEKIITLSEYEKADVVCIYSAYAGEIDVWKVFYDAVSKEKKVLLPKVLDDFVMEFYNINSKEDVVCGYKGIMEPRMTSGAYRKLHEEKVFMIVPGVAFDKKGGRIGMGKGFYDRYIEKFLPDFLCGVCGQYQIKDEIPMEEHDRYLDMVITEKNIYKK